MRPIIAISIAIAVSANAPHSSASERIDLDVPGNLEAVERDHPDHFAKIQGILAEVPRRPPADDSVAKWMRTEFQARDVRYTDLLMTSLPPKKRLEFSLDKTSYIKVIRLDIDARSMPATKALVR